MKKELSSTAEASLAWGRWLLDNLEAQLEDGTRQGLPADAAAMGVAHIVHGMQLALNIGDCSPQVMAAWLRVIATSLEKGATPPLLAWVTVEAGHDGKPH